MTSYERGDVVLVDLGMTSKIRPCLVISVPDSDSQRNMSVVIPMTTQIRGGESEVQFPKPPWLRETCVLNVIGILGVDNARIERKINRLPAAVVEEVSRTLRRILSL